MNISVIGTGSIGRRHIGNFLSIGARVTAYDADPAMRARAAGLLPAATYVDALDQALAGADGVAICTPPDSHVAIGQRALAAKAHLLIEKPIAHTLDGLEDLLKACDRASKVVLTAYNWRYWPPMHKVQELLAQGRIGRVLVARTEYSYDVTQRYQGKPARQFYMSNAAQGGGAILDESHAVDYMRWHLGEAAEVFAVVDRVSTLDQDSDDVCELIVKFERGALGNLHMDLFSPVMHGHFEFIGQRGILRWDRPLNQVSVFDSGAQRWEVYPFACQLNDMYVDEARHFVDCIQGKATPACDGWDGLKTLRLCLAAVQSSNERRWVRLSRVADRDYALAVIPARGGSKGLPRKNLLRLGRLSLIGHALASAREAGRLSRTVVSTDDPEIAEEARRHGGEVPFVRPAELASDEAGMLPVLQHAVRWLETSERVTPGLVVLLQPTSPFRTGADIDATIEKVVTTGADSAQTLVEVAYHPFFMSTLDEDHVRLLFPEHVGKYGRRQDPPKVYQPSGAVYVTRRRTLMDEGRILGANHRGLVMGYEASVKIDTEWEFRLAELVLASGRAPIPKERR